MRIKQLEAVLCVLCTLASVGLTQGQTWIQMKAPSTIYQSVACSADGRTIIADIQAGTVYFSTNAGANWMPVISTGESWHCVACSADASKLFAGAGDLLISTNSGLTWATNNAPAGYCLGIACSADGTKVAVASGIGPLLLSTNSGITLTSNTAPGGGFASIACSADGTKLVGTYTSQFTQSETYGGHFPIYRSVDSGATWTETGAPAADYLGLASSADGTTLVAVCQYGILISKNSGLTWGTNAFPTLWAVACSTDGTRLAAGQGYTDGAFSGVIFTSMDSGETWVTNNVPTLDWTGLAMSADGSFITASALSDGGPGGIYTTQIPAQPSLKIVPSASTLQLSWPLPSPGFVLQQSSQLNPPNWVNVTNTPAQCGYYNQVTISPPVSGNAYYRLANQ